MNHNKYNAPHLDQYPDDFEDLEREGWFVRSSPDGEGARVLLLPPGVFDTSDTPDTPSVEALGRLPGIGVYAVEDNAAGVTAQAAVQTRLHGGDRHSAFAAPDRRASLLTQRALRFVDADNLKFRWLSDGGGLQGSDNYKTYTQKVDELTEALRQDARNGQIEKFGDEWMERSRKIGLEAVKATWTYAMVAQPMGFTKVAKVSSSSYVNPDFDSIKEVTGYLELEH